MKALNAFGLLVAVALCLRVTDANATLLNVTGPSVPLKIGQTFAIDVAVAGVSNLYAFQFDLTFDPRVVAAVSNAEGTFLGQGGPTYFINGTNDNTNGVVAQTADSLGALAPGVTGAGLLAVIQFTAVGSGIANIGLGNILLLDSGLYGIPLDGIQVGTVSVAGVPEPGTLGLMGFALLTVVWSLLRRAPERCAGLPTVLGGGRRLR